MEKIKSVCSKLVSWVKAHLKVVVAVIAVVVIAVVAVNLIGVGKKGAVKKYISALNSCNDGKIIKAMDIKAAIAWSGAYGDDKIKKFKDNLEDVDDDEVETYEDTIKDAYDEGDKGKIKYQLKDVVYTTKAKDDKNLTKVVCKVKVTSKPDDKDEDEDKIWKKDKKYKSSIETYVTFYLYKNKVIGSTLSYWD